MLFSEQNIVVRNRNKDLDEVKDWSWIKRMNMTRGTVMLDPNQPEILDREKLTENEWLFFKNIQEKNPTGRTSLLLFKEKACSLFEKIQREVLGKQEILSRGLHRFNKRKGVSVR
ncbi:hypothetical protein ACLOAU_24700 [Niabella sp. CJ426]|uniref:hypothetical protein n=1 Tax=Niabella sp. CJ426 TaxID=3393740 RepID=UPI003D03DC52